MVDTLEKEEKREQIAHEVIQQVSALEGQATETTPLDTLNRILAEISAEEAKIPLKSKEAGLASGAANSARRKTEDLRNKKEAEETKDVLEGIAQAAGGVAGGLMAASAADVAFSQQMFKYMSPAEQKFFNSLSGPQSLVMLDKDGELLDKDGKVVTDANGQPRVETVDGSLLQADFAHIKYHTLSKDEQKEIGAPPGEAPDGKRLHEALQRLEGAQVARGMEQGLSLGEAREQIRGDFARAHDQVDSTVAMEENARAMEAAAKLNPTLAMTSVMASLTAKYHEDKLSADLQKVVGDLSGEKSSPRQGVHISGDPAAQIVFGGKLESSEHYR